MSDQSKTADPPVLSRSDPRVVGWLSAEEPTLVLCASCYGRLVLVGEGECLGDAICQECST